MSTTDNNAKAASTTGATAAKPTEVPAAVKATAATADGYSTPYGVYSGQPDILYPNISISVSKSEFNAVDSWNIDQPFESEYYSLTGMKVYNPVKGIYIKKSGSKSKIVMIK